MKGLDTGEGGVCAVIRRVESHGLWLDVQAQFRARHADLCGGDLPLALRSELSSEEEQRVRDALAAAGAACDAPAAEAPAPAPPRSTPEDAVQDDLEDGDGGVGADDVELGLGCEIQDDAAS